MNLINKRIINGSEDNENDSDMNNNDLDLMFDINL